MIVMTSFDKKKKEYRDANKERNNEYFKKHYQEHKSKKRRQRIYSLYGVSYEQYEELYNKQEGNCAICNKKHDTLCVDHNHNTNKFRGLLCNKCNLALGMLQDNIDFLKSAITYLESNNE